MRLKLLLPRLPLCAIVTGRNHEVPGRRDPAGLEEIEMPAKADPIDESFETRVIWNALGQLKEVAALEASEQQPRAKLDAAEKLREKTAENEKS